MARPDLKPLSQSERSEIIAAGPKGILVGGMALAFWADEFSVLPSGLLEAGITFDVDFLGTRKEAETTANQLAGLMPGRVEILLPDMDRQTANSAKILLQTFHDRTTALEIDYVSGLFGFTPEAEQRLRMRAFSVETSRGSVKVMHPIDCLISRVMNLDGLPSKQNSAGVAQCRLAVAVTRSFIHRVCGDPSKQAMKTALKAAEAVAELALLAPARRIAIEYGIDLLEAIPADRIRSEQFQLQRWPQIQQAVAEGIEKLKGQREQRRKRTKKV